MHAERQLRLELIVGGLQILGPRRLLLALAGASLLGGAVAVGSGVTFGLFSAKQTSGTNSFSAGVVSLSTTAQTTCTISNMIPGESSTGYSTGTKADQQCSLAVKYTGNASAWLALDVSIASTATGSPVQSYSGSTPSAAAGLYDSSATGLQVLVKDNQTTPITYMTGTTLGGSGTSGASPSVIDLLVNTSAFTNNQAVTFTIDYYLPTTATNAYDSAASSITLTAHAVQSASNGNTTGCIAGTVCSNIPNWS